jgi:hypothetical protein
MSPVYTEDRGEGAENDSLDLKYNQDYTNHD